MSDETYLDVNLQPFYRVKAANRAVAEALVLGLMQELSDRDATIVELRNEVERLSGAVVKWASERDRANAAEATIDAMNAAKGRCDGIAKCEIHPIWGTYQIRCPECKRSSAHRVTRESAWRDWFSDVITHGGQSEW